MPAPAPRLVISAPFGNYVQPNFAIATLGTFTAARRPGRLWRILKTVRYYRRLGAWVNKIGLRNPGIDWLADQVRRRKIRVEDKILSIHGFVADDWWRLLDVATDLKPLAIELNMSCPNVGEIDWPPDLFARAHGSGVRVIVKLPPVQYELLFAEAIEAGIRRFHACNTLPIPAGGLSGRPLKPVALQCIRRLYETVPAAARDSLRILGGGGVRQPSDVDDYAKAGAHAIAVGTKVMNPGYLFSTRGVESIATHAESLLAQRPSLFDA